MGERRAALEAERRGTRVVRMTTSDALKELMALAAGEPDTVEHFLNHGDETWCHHEHLDDMAELYYLLGGNR